MASNGKVDYDIFSYYLSDDEKAYPSELEIGGYDEKYIDQSKPLT